MDFNFGTNAIVEDILKVPEQFRGMYVAGEGDNEGKHVLAEAHKPAATAIDGFNKTNKALRTEVTNLKSARVDLTPWLSLGGLVGLEDGAEVTPEALSEAIGKLRQEPGQSKANYERMKKDLEDAHARALKAKDGELTAMNGSLSKYLVDSAATSAIAAAKGSVPLLLPHIKGMTKVVKEDGDFQVRVVDAEGNYRGGATGGNMTIAELVAELKADATFGRAFESEARSSSTGGARSSTTTAGAETATRNARATDTSKMSATEKISAGFAKRDLAVRR